MERPSHEHRALALVYARTDTDDGQMSWEAIEKQKHRCRSAIAQLGARVVGEFVDVGELGHRINRGGLNQLLAYVEEREVDLVAVSSMDRLARRTEAISDLLLRLNEHGTRVLIAEDDAVIDVLLPTDAETSNETNEGGDDE